MELTRRTALQLQRRSQGLCPRCGDPALGFFYCWKCREKRNKKERSYKRKRPKHTRRSYAQQRERDRVAYQAARAAGLCHKCGQPSLRFSECADCRRIKAENRLRKAQRGA